MTGTTLVVGIAAMVLLLASRTCMAGAPPRAETVRTYVAKFNRLYEQYSMQHVNAVPDAEAADFLASRVPAFVCPDQRIEEIYYFRWWTYRKHVKRAPDGFVLTEFLAPVRWAGRHGSISCAAGHHIREGRWLRDRQIMDDYAAFWFRGGGSPRRYSFWAADSLWNKYLVDGNRAFVVALLDDLVRNYEAWERERLDPSGLYWQKDGADGMEVSIGGSGYRATINSYQYGDAMAIAAIADLAGRRDLAEAYRAKAAGIQQRVEEALWDKEAGFFKVLPRGGGALADVRELHGYVPWYFNLPGPGREGAWKELMDEQGFFAPFGPTTAERRHPRFRFAHGHDCLWNGPSWPYATTQTLVALANLLNDYRQETVSAKDYFAVLQAYTKGHDKDGRPWIAEDLDGVTGRWIVDKPRSLFYNHSGYCDLVITGLVGLRPRPDGRVVVNPLVPGEAWDWFALDGIAYRGHTLGIFYDREGERFGRGRGLTLWIDGRRAARTDRLGRLEAALPEVCP